MKKLSQFSAIVAGLLFVSGGVALMTGGPAVAQGGGGRVSDVRVVNTAAEAVPINVQGTPTVNVGNTPTVNVNSLPAVQVGNGAGNPVPVSVTNLPGGQSPEETFTLHAQMTIGPEEFTSPTVVAYTVPAGKRLLITYVDYRAAIGNGADHIFRINGPDSSFSFFVEKEFQGTDHGSEACEMSFNEGEQVRMSVHKDVANPPGATSFPHVWWTGHLVDMP